MIIAGSRAAKMLARLRKKTHLYTKGEQTMIKSGIMKRKYKKKLNMKNAKKFAKKNAVPLSFGAGLGLGFLED